MQMLSFYLLYFVYWGCSWCGDTHYANLIFVVDIILGVMVHNRVAQWLMLLPNSERALQPKSLLQP